MIIRKPYAFLIKNFRKVHLVLLLLSFLVFRANLQVNAFLKEFVTDQFYNTPISDYLNIITYIALIFMLVVIGLLIYLLRQKGKPWKMYLVLAIIYFLVFVVFLSNTMYFIGFSNSDFNIQSAIMLRDLTFIVSVPQYVAFIILVIRILGIDLEKFDFSHDAEFLEIQDSDKEEVEINFEFDKHIIFRLWQKLLRNFDYFYQEHRFIVNVIATVIVIVIIYNIYYFFGVTHKSYRQGQTLKIDGYEITVNDSYYTDKDFNGNKIEKGKAFVILNMTVKNRNKDEVMKMDNFHLMNWSDDYTYTLSYNNSFNDLGKTYSDEKWDALKTYKFLLIFKVNEKNSFSKFVLYYQEYHNAMETYRRKLKLNVKNISNIRNKGVYRNNKEIPFETVSGAKKNVTFTSAELGKEFEYKKYQCSAYNCGVVDDVVKALGSSQILKITYDSADFDGEDFVDFSKKYGKINYVNNKGKTKEIDVEDAVGREYQGRYLYLKVPTGINTKKKIEITYVIRNKKYVYKIK